MSDQICLDYANQVLLSKSAISPIAMALSVSLCLSVCICVLLSFAQVVSLGKSQISKMTIDFISFLLYHFFISFMLFYIIFITISFARWPTRWRRF